jgi:hypothetical protein
MATRDEIDPPARGISKLAIAAQKQSAQPLQHLPLRYM